MLITGEGVTHLSSFDMGFYCSNTAVKAYIMFKMCIIKHIEQIFVLFEYYSKI